MKNDLVIVSTTFNNKKEASQLCRYFVKKRIVACGQISSGITSCYIWKGRLVEENEYMLSFKTRKKYKKKVVKMLRKKHSYDTPEILIHKECEVDKDYLEWIQEVI